MFGRGDHIDSSYPSFRSLPRDCVSVVAESYFTSTPIDMTQTSNLGLGTTSPALSRRRQPSRHPAFPPPTSAASQSTPLQSHLTARHPLETAIDGLDTPPLHLAPSHPPPHGSPRAALRLQGRCPICNEPLQDFCRPPGESERAGLSGCFGGLAGVSGCAEFGLDGWGGLEGTAVGDAETYGRWGVAARRQ